MGQRSQQRTLLRHLPVALLLLLAVSPVLAETAHCDFDSGVIRSTLSADRSSGSVEFEGVTFGRLRFDGEAAETAGRLALNRCVVLNVEDSDVVTIGRGAFGLFAEDSVIRLAFFVELDSTTLATILPAEFDHFIAEFRKQPPGSGRIEAKAVIENRRLFWEEYKLTWEGDAPFNPLDEKTLFFPFLDEYIAGGSTTILTPLDQAGMKPMAGRRLFKATIRFHPNYYDRRTFQVKFRDDAAEASLGEFLMDYEERRPFLSHVLPFVRLPMTLEYRVEGAYLRLLSSRLARKAR